MESSACVNCGQEVVHTSVSGKGKWLHYNPPVIGLCDKPEPCKGDE
jgi:hypothetical protein